MVRSLTLILLLLIPGVFLNAQIESCVVPQHISENRLPGEVFDLNSAWTCMKRVPRRELTLQSYESYDAMQHISECGLPGEVSDLNSALTCFLGSPGTEVTLRPGESCVFIQHISVDGLSGEVYHIVILMT